MLRKILNNFASRLKGQPYQIDTALNSIDLIGIIFTRFFMIVRGARYKMRLRKSGPLFLGRRSRIVSPRKIEFLGVATLNDNSLIDARVKTMVSIGKNFTLGQNSIIEGFGVITNLGSKLTVGSNVGISANSLISIRGNVEIGNDVIIGPYFSLHPENHIFKCTDLPIRLQGERRKGICIKNNVWIGARVTILDGVTIGAGTIVAAGAVVVKDIPDNCIAAGVPAKVISHRDR